MEIKTLQVEPIGANCYVVSENQEAFIVDPGGNGEKIIDIAHHFNVKYILLTHSHFDHIGALNEVTKAFPHALVALHRLEKEFLYSPSQNLSHIFDADFVYEGVVNIELEDEQLLDFAGRNIVVKHVPGHTVGGVCYCFDDVCFSGDTLFKLSVGSTDFLGGNSELLLQKIKEKLYSLPGRTTVYPGHDGKTTIAWEKKRNPYVRA